MYELSPRIFNEGIVIWQYRSFRSNGVSRAQSYGKTFLNGASVEKNCRGRISLERCRKADGKEGTRRETSGGKERWKGSRESGGCAATRGPRAHAWREYHQDGRYGSSGIHIACRGNYVKSSVLTKCKCKLRRGAPFLHIRSVLIAEVSPRCIYEFTTGRKFLVGREKRDHAQVAGGHLAMSAERGASW